MSQMPRYVANSHKALEVIVWLASAAPDIDIYHIVKAIFFADKHHVIEYGRPICGDSYSAAPYGPLAQIAHGILRQEPIQMLALGTNGELPFSVDGRHRVTAYRSPNLRRLSRSEIAALNVGLNHVHNKSFNDLYVETHDDPAYLNAKGGRIDYRDFLPENLENREEKAEDLLESAEYMVF